MMPTHGSPEAAPPVVVVSGHTMALAVVRALGEVGVRVLVLHHDERDMAHASRYVEAEARIPPPNTREAEFVAALLRHAPRPGRAVLVPSSDDALAAVSRHREALDRRYLVASPPWELARNFIEKRRTYELASRAGVPVPRTIPAATDAEARAAARELGFPLLVKPSQSHLFFERYRRKMMVVSDERELTARLAEARAARLEVVLQEIVPGPDTEVVNYNAYAWGGCSLVEFTARQLRKAPPRFGSPRAVVSERIEGVLEPGRRALHALGVEGFACSEFKRDPRDGRYKLLDVNGRPNLSGLLAVRSGINFPLLQYRHLAAGELPRSTPFQPGVYWVDVLRDAAYGLRHLFEERPSPRALLAPYLGPGCDAISDVRDLRPLLLRCAYLARTALGGGWIARAAAHRASANGDVRQEGGIL